MMDLARTIRAVAVAIAVWVVVVIALFLSRDPDVLRQQIADHIATATGRAVTIAGTPRLALFPSPRIVVSRLAIANPSGFSGVNLFSVDRLEAEIAFLPLLSGKVVIGGLILERPVLDLKIDSRGRANWRFRPAAGAPARGLSFSLSAVTVHDAVARFVNSATGETHELRLASLAIRADAPTRSLEISLDGLYRERVVRLSAHVVKLPALIGGARVPARIEGRFGSETMTFVGVVAGLPDAPVVDGRITASINGLDGLGALVGTELPGLGEAFLSGHLSVGRHGLRFDDAHVLAGDNDVSGTLDIDLTGERPRLRGDFSAVRLETEALAGAIWAGVIGRDRPAPTESEEADPAPLFGERTLPFAALRLLDLDLDFRGDSVTFAGQELTDVAVSIALVDGRLRIGPVRVGLAGGVARGHFEADASRIPPRLSLDFVADGLNIAQMARTDPGADLIGGDLTVRVDLSGRGDTLRDIAASLDGGFGMTVTGGRITSAYLAARPLDVIELIVPWFEDYEVTEIMRLVVDFDIVDGVATARELALETPRMILVGVGAIDLAGEILHFDLTPEAKDPAIADLTVPLIVTGRLTEPAVLPNPSGRVMVVASNEPTEEPLRPWPDPPGGRTIVASGDDASVPYPYGGSATGLSSLFRDLVDAVVAAIRAQP